MLSNKSDIVRSMTPRETSEALIYACRIQNINPKTLSADIYIPQINRSYYGVYIGEGILGANYRSGGLPDATSEGLVALYSKSGTPVILGYIPPSSFNAGNEKFEYIDAGEYQNMSSGKAFAKFDKFGTAHIGSAGVGSRVFKSDGGVYDYHLNCTDISNLSKKELITDSKDGIISIYEKKELYEKSDIKTYSADEIKENMTAIEPLIVDSAKKITEDLFGQYGIFNELSGLIEAAVALKDFSLEFENYKKKTDAAKISYSGLSVSTEYFGNDVFSINVSDEEGNLVSGIKFTKDGAELTGTWKS